MKKVSLLLVTIIPYMLLADESKVYIDMNPSVLSYSDNGTTSDFKPTGFKWTAGYIVKDFDFVSFGVEGSLLLGVDNDVKSKVKNSKGNSFTNAIVSIDKMYSLHLKSILPITNGFNANLYIGGTRGKLLSSSDQSSSSDSVENSVSYGIGLEYWSSADISVYANYMQYFKNLNAIEVGVGFRF